MATDTAVTSGTRGSAPSGEERESARPRIIAGMSVDCLERPGVTPGRREMVAQGTPEPEPEPEPERRRPDEPIPEIAPPPSETEPKPYKPDEPIPEIAPPDPSRRREEPDDQ
jgi:hypothetical protein